MSKILLVGLGGFVGAILRYALSGLVHNLSHSIAFPLYEWLVIQAKERGLAGATVLRGLMGFGANSRIHTSKILRLSLDLPIVVEIVDTPEKINSYLEGVENVINEGLVTLEKAEIHIYKSGSQAF